MIRRGDAVISDAQDNFLRAECTKIFVVRPQRDRLLHDSRRADEFADCEEPCARDNSRTPS